MKKKNYTPPRLTVAVFKQERGYATSYRLAIFESSCEAGSDDLEQRQMSDHGWGSDWNY